MLKALALIYGIAAYLLFLVVFLYAIGFVGNWLVPKSIDAGTEGDLVWSLLVNAALLGVFAVQHSVMSRPGFKRWWTKIVPEPIERSTYVLLTSLALVLLFWEWRPLRSVIWNVENSAGSLALWGFFGLGWLIVLTSTFLINHFDLFGLRQVYLNLRSEKYSHLEFQDHRAIQAGAPSDHARLRHRLLGDATDDPRAPGVCGCNDNLHPHRPAT